MSFIVYNNKTYPCRHEVDGEVGKLCISYVDVNGRDRWLEFLEEGPAGIRWILDEHSSGKKDIVTADWLHEKDAEFLKSVFDNPQIKIKEMYYVFDEK